MPFIKIRWYVHSCEKMLIEKIVSLQIVSHSILSFSLGMQFMRKKGGVVLWWHEEMQDCSHCSSSRRKRRRRREGWGKNRRTALCNALSAQGRAHAAATGWMPTCRNVGRGVQGSAQPAPWCTTAAAAAVHQLPECILLGQRPSLSLIPFNIQVVASEQNSKELPLKKRNM